MKNKKLKPFNLEAALQGKPVVTRDGRPVKIAGYNPDALKLFKLIGWLDNMTCSWRADGKHIYTEEHADDLFMLSETVTLWVNVYEYEGRPFTGSTFETKEDAESSRQDAGNKYVGTYPLTIEL